eukprot:scaffold31_cov263-Pinguiococcus_pyrenoidosus.AAC.28
MKVQSSQPGRQNRHTVDVLSPQSSVQNCLLWYLSRLRSARPIAFKGPRFPRKTRLESKSSFASPSPASAAFRGRLSCCATHSLVLSTQLLCARTRSP